MKIIVVFVFVMAIVCAHAQELDRGAMPFEAEGVVRSASQIRDAPPHGIFNLFVGKPILETQQGSTVKIIGKKTYHGFSGTHVWYQIEQIDGQEANSSGPSWVYSGVEGKSGFIQVEKVME